MQRDTDLISTNERDFILKALKEEVRVDGRTPYEHRKITYQFSLDDRCATLDLGQTKVMTVITPTLTAPYEDRPNEGAVRFNVEFSPMASPSFQAGRPGEAAIDVTRLLERAFRDSRAIDQEALCVLAGHRVWSLSVDVHVLDNGGNLADACMLCTLAALMAFRRPDAQVAAGGAGADDGRARVTVLSPSVCEPVPLSLHHLPLAVSFALFQDGDVLVVDPDNREEAAAAGLMTVVVNTHSDICSVRKVSGVGISMAQVHRMVRLASSRAGEVMEGLKAALQRHDTSRVAARVRRHTHVAAQPSVPGRSVAVLPSGAVAGSNASDGAALDDAMEGQHSESDSSSSSDEEDAEDESDDEDDGMHDAESPPGKASQRAVPPQRASNTVPPSMIVPATGLESKGRSTIVGKKAKGLPTKPHAGHLADILGGEGTLEEDLAAMQSAFKKRK
ncbi:g1702 [Coccomyxa elongata]